MCQKQNALAGDVVILDFSFGFFTNNVMNVILFSSSSCEYPRVLRFLTL